MHKLSFELRSYNSNRFVGDLQQLWQDLGQTEVDLAHLNLPSFNKSYC